MHHPDQDPRPYGEQLRALADSLPDPDADPDGYTYHMMTAAHVAITAALDVRNRGAGKHRAGA